MASTAIGAIAEKGADQTYNTIWSLIQRKWAHDDRSHAENRQDELIRRAWDREDALRQEMYGREDTAYQRSVADAEAAGLSPLAVSQLDSAGSPAIQASMQSQPDVMAPNSYMSNSSASSASIAGAFLSQANLDEMRRHNIAMEGINQQKADDYFTTQQTALALQGEKLNNDFELKKEELSIEDRKAWNSVSNLIATLSQNQVFHDDEMSWKKQQDTRDRAENQSKITYQAYEHMCKQLGVAITPQIYDNLNDYNDAMARFNSNIISRVKNFLMLGTAQTNEQKSITESASESNGINLTIPGGAGAGMNGADSGSYSMSEKHEKHSQALLQGEFGGLTCPIYVPKY